MDWMRDYKLKLNPNKMEVLMVRNNNLRDVIDLPVLDRAALPPKEQVHSLRELLDPGLTLISSAKAMARSVFYQLRLIQQLRLFLEEKDLRTVAHCLMEEAVDELRLHVVTCQEQLCILQSEVDQAKTQQLVLLLQCNAHLLRWPVICGELDLEAIRLGHVESMQEEAAAQLLGQLSHLDLLNLLLMLEEKNLHQMGTSLKEMVTILNGSQAKLQEWQSCCEDSRFSIKQCPRTLTDPSDLIILRLWEMLDKHGQEKQLFRTYETLAGRGSRLCQELRMLQVQLATPFSQLPKLESDNERLHCIMYGDSNQLMLHAQELSEPLEQLGMMQAKLYQMLMDTLSELKAKRKSLQSHFQKAERSLYMHFFNNPAQLKELVQELEKQALAFS